MANKTNLATLYASSLPERQKKKLLDVYKEYTKLARIFEQTFKNRGTKNIAIHQLNSMTPHQQDDKYFPWKLDDCTEEEKNYYQDIVQNSNTSQHHPNYCYVSIEQINKDTDNSHVIYASPANYRMVGKNNLLPSMVERFILTYEKNEEFNGINFIINGKYLAKYSGYQSFENITDSLNDKTFVPNLSCLMGLVARLNDEKIANYSSKELSDIGFEALASEFSIPYEQVIQGVQSNLTELTHALIKEIHYKRYFDNYMKKAEEDGLIRSASEFQNLINIRHFLSHQLETMDGFGRFTNGDNNQNKSIRKRYLESYNNIYDKPLIQRIDTYVELSNVFKNLVEGLNPNFFIRQSQESNSKFITRIKNYLKNNPNTPILVEMNYSHNNDKKDALYKNLKKIAPTAEIIDDFTNFKYDEAFLDRICNYNLRTRYLTTFQELEREISEYFLFNGQNYSPKECWKILSKNKILTKEEDQKFTEYRILRNALSHEILDDQLNKKLNENIEEFIRTTRNLEKRLAKEKPKNITHHKDNIYIITHDNQKKVYIDIVEKKVIDVEENSTDTDKAKPKAKKTPAKGYYTEEYPNGCAISLKGTSILYCRTPSGFVINPEKQSIIFPDGSKIFLSGKETNCFIFANKDKVITDKKMKILNLILNGKSVNISKNEQLNIGSNQQIKTNKDKQISTIIQTLNSNIKQNILIQTQENDIVISFSDGLKWTIGSNTNEITCNNQPLNYQERKKFALSFNNLTPTSTLPQKER